MRTQVDLFRAGPRIWFLAAQRNHRRHGLVIDLHCHLLPAVDDGSKTIEQSVGVLNVMAKNGVTDVCLTPHLSTSELEPNQLRARLESHDTAFARLSEVAPTLPKMHRGVELMLSEPISKGVVLTRRISLAASRYILVEFPPSLAAAAIRGLLSEIVQQGFVPLIAHAERYAVATPAEVFSWRDLGCVIQIDATTLVANRGPSGQRARALIEGGLGDVLAADNHGDDRTLSVAEHYFRQTGHPVQSDLLLKVNPQAVLHDTAFDAVPPLRFTAPWTDRLRGWLRRTR